jgi:transposase
MGKPAKIALIAVMRRMVVLSNALLRKQSHWRPNPA